MDAAQGFIEDMGQHMTGWGLARTTGRIYAYLLLQSEPVGLDRLAADLGIAKSGASVGARQLVAFGMARAVGTSTPTRADAGSTSATRPATGSR